ncbi:predicted protein [Chaetoceros tenuissimus]|uniref:Uncharacterized protein n=1 Tax=Chaetoceros tenuissimus TaxID=426638 RepID=A0AAD3HFP2_9STRA|nr:predicted protein [Chaetoceros tenuissimus]
MTEQNNNQNPNEAYYLHPSNVPNAYEQFRADNAAMEDELIEKVITRVMSKSIESIGNVILEKIQFLVPYLLILFLFAVWILRRLFFKRQSSGVPSVEDSRVPPVVNVDDNSSKKSYAGRLKLSVWDTEGIDVRDLTMPKEIACQKKPMLDNPIDLETQNFEKLRRATKDKVATLRFEKEIEFSIPTQDEEVETIGNLIQNAKAIPYKKVLERERRVWFGENEDEAGDHDRRLKSNVLGETLKASLSVSALTTIETNYKGKYEIKFEGRKWVNGPLLLWCVMQEGEYIRIFGESKAESNEWTEAESNKKDDIETKLSEYPKDKLVKVLAFLVCEGSKENTNDSDKKNGRDYKRPAWKEEKPKDGEKIRTVDGVEYHWCPHCNKGNSMWTTHAKHLTPEEFKAQQKEKDRSKEEETKPDISDLWSNNLPDIVEVDIEEDNSNADYFPLCKTKTEPNTDEIFEREMEEYNSSGASEGGNLNPTQASTNSVEHRIDEKATKTTPTVEEQVKELLATVEILTKKRNEYHLNKSIKSNRVIQYLRSRERPPVWEQLVEQNTEHYGFVDPGTEPTSLDWSNLHLEELKNRDGVSFGKPEGADHTSHKADDTEQSNPGAPQINDNEKKESRPSESESVFHPSERTEGDDNKTRLESLDLDQPRLQIALKTCHL